MKLRHDLAALLPRLREDDLPKFCAFHERYAPHLQAIAANLYDRLEAADQARFLTWFLKRWARIDLVNPVERRLYDATLARLRQERREDVELGGRTYRLRDMKSQGQDFKLLGYDWCLGVHDIYYNQYEQGDVALRPGDVIIDAGAFIGDTAVYFHHKLQGRCQLHSFELLDENLALMLHNLERNGVADERIVINKLALADRSGDEVVVANGASQGSTSMFGRTGGGTRVQTVTLDDYVTRLQLPRVDFIKMDIEGAESLALAGARHTIAHFQPRLAICLYHQWNDVVTVPQAILDTGVDYRFRFKWVQLRDGWEAILLAVPAEQATPRPIPAAAAPDALETALTTLSRLVNRQHAALAALQRDRRAGPAPALPAEAVCDEQPAIAA